MDIETFEVFSCVSTEEPQLYEQKNRIVLKGVITESSGESVVGLCRSFIRPAGTHFSVISDGDNRKIFVNINFSKLKDLDRLKTIFKSAYDHIKNTQIAKSVALSKDNLIKVSYLKDIIAIENSVKLYDTYVHPVLSNDKMCIYMDNNEVYTTKIYRYEKLLLRGGLIVGDNVLKMFTDDKDVMTHVICPNNMSTTLHRIKPNSLKTANVTRLIVYDYDLKKMVKYLELPPPKRLWIYVSNIAFLKDNYDLITKILFWNNKYCGCPESLAIPIISTSDIKTDVNVEIKRYKYKLSNYETKFISNLNTTTSKTSIDILLDAKLSSIIKVNREIAKCDIENVCQVCCIECPEKYMCWSDCSHNYCVACLGRQLTTQEMSKKSADVLKCYICRSHISTFIVPTEMIWSKILFLNRVITKIVGRKTIIYCQKELIEKIFIALESMVDIHRLDIANNRHILSTDGVYIVDYKNSNETKYVKNIDTIVVATLDCEFITKCESLGYDYINNNKRVNIYILEYV
jgi:hypothetical protein